MKYLATQMTYVLLCKREQDNVNAIDLLEGGSSTVVKGHVPRELVSHKPTSITRRQLHSTYTAFKVISQISRQQAAEADLHKSRAFKRRCSLWRRLLLVQNQYSDNIQLQHKPSSTCSPVVAVITSKSHWTRACSAPSVI